MLFPEHNYRFGQFDNEASVEDMVSVLGCWDISLAPIHYF